MTTAATATTTLFTAHLQSFRNAFISGENTRLILGNTLNRLSNQFPTDLLRSNVQLYSQQLAELQEYIVVNIIPKLIEEGLRNGTFSPQSSLESLNSITQTQLEQLITQTQVGNSQPTARVTEVHNSPPRLQNNYVQTDMTEVTERTELTDSVPRELKNLHLFSRHASLKKGIYTFNISNLYTNTNTVPKIKAVKITSFNINSKCLYNLNETNNMLTIIHSNQTQKADITLPIGAYDFDGLINCINGYLSEYSITFTHNNVKNRIFIKHKNGSPFSIYFTQGLSNVMGFAKRDYSNNDLYVGEKEPCTNVYQNIYLRLYLNDKEIPRVKTSLPGFSYFHDSHTDGNSADTFEIYDDIDANTISVSLWDTQHELITRSCAFDIVVQLEQSKS